MVGLVSFVLGGGGLKEGEGVKGGATPAQSFSMLADILSDCCHFSEILSDHMLNRNLHVFKVHTHLYLFLKGFQMNVIK